ncbi:MAG: xanthine dehydrogenase family protein molybdopterin-binding subunit [Rhodospirillales bacterium]|nr:xanthine dehydrogenase family protein molybdopterin-binding subunit [Rhodospirillales bacterium]
MEMTDAPSMIGRPLARLDGRAKVTGAARYAAEFAPPGMLHGFLVDATVATGRVAALDARTALASPGVHAVIWHGNAPRLPWNEPVSPEFTRPDGARLRAFADDRVRFVGQPIAVVVADTIEQAHFAASLINVTYAEQRDPVVDFTEASAAATLRRDDTTARGDPDAAFAASDAQVDCSTVIARETHSPLESHVTIAHWQQGKLRLWDKSQWVSNVARVLAGDFGLEPGDVEVISPYVGGAFGSGGRVWPHTEIAAIAARELDRPVKIELTRRQMFNLVGHRPYTEQRVRLGANSDGLLTAILHDGAAETSRHERFSEGLLRPTRMLYGCADVATSYIVVPRDTSTPTYMRAPGEASGLFALETAMDELAWQLRLDPVELRLRNDPTHDLHSNLPFSSRSLAACLRQGAETFGWSKRRLEPGSWIEDGEQVGYGVAVATYPANYVRASARVRLSANGSATVESATSDMGPGTYTSLAQVAADALGLPVEAIAVEIGRSALPNTPPHGGSMTMASVGSAVLAACNAVKQKLAQITGTEHAPAKLVPAPEDSLVEQLRRAGLAQIEADGHSNPGDTAKRFSMHAFGAVFVEVRVDRELGLVRIPRIHGAYGVGRVVNPRLTRSQCTGGMIGGVGMALFEASELDRASGRVINADLAEYLIPTQADIGELTVAFVEETDPHVNPLGVKGVGEIAVCGAAPAIANAVWHATGKRLRDLPIRLEALLERRM